VQFDRGFGDVKFIGLSKRPASMAHDQWLRYWIEVHGPLAHGVPEFTRHYGKYVHNYVIPSESTQQWESTTTTASSRSGFRVSRISSRA
jgi:hypothetical protein